jgi:hypothetical protein
MRAKFHINSTKMEEASFALLQMTRITNTYQVSRPDHYYVNHLSEYEHKVRRKTHNVSLAVSRSAGMSASALAAECAPAALAGRPPEAVFLALVPFYGGLPPATDATNFKVGSVGEGNSVVNRTVKAWQGMATVCSLLKYYGRVVVGVSSAEDEAAMEEHVSGVIRAEHTFGLIAIDRFVRCFHTGDLLPTPHLIACLFLLLYFLITFAIFNYFCYRFQC